MKKLTYSDLLSLVAAQKRQIKMLEAEVVSQKRQIIVLMDDTERMGTEEAALRTKLLEFTWPKTV